MLPLMIACKVFDFVSKENGWLAASKVRYSAYSLPNGFYCISITYVELLIRKN